MSTDRGFGRVSVNRDIDHPNASHLPYPTNRLLGLVSSDESARRVIERLRSDQGIQHDLRWQAVRSGN